MRWPLPFDECMVRTRPPAIRPGGEISRMIDIAVTLLPQPDFADQPERAPL